MLSKKLWTLERFGLTPHKIRARLSDTALPVVLSVSFPKAGTHLLERALCLYPKIHRRIIPTVHEDNIQRWGDLESLLERCRPGELIVAHLHYSQERHRAILFSETRCIFMIRDPRDILVSQAHFVFKNKKHPLHRAFAAEPDLKARVRLSVRGCDDLGLLPFAERLRKYLGWLESSDFLTIRFEDLIGSEGRGDDELQVQAVYRIFEHVGVSLDDESALNLSRRLFSNTSPTFRRGKVGQWRASFDEDLKQEFKENANQELVRYGYESGDRW